MHSTTRLNTKLNSTFCQSEESRFDFRQTYGFLPVLRVPTGSDVYGVTFTFTLLAIYTLLFHSNKVLGLTLCSPHSLQQALWLCDSCPYLDLIQNWRLWLVLLSCSPWIKLSNATGLSFSISYSSCFLTKHLSLQKCTAHLTCTHWHSTSKEEFIPFVYAFVGTA